MISYQKEEFYSLAKDAQAWDLFKQHYSEIAEYTDTIKFKLNFKAYDRLNAVDKLEIHSIRDNGKIIGYNMWILSYYIHATDSLTATSDNLYLHPDYRKGLNGYKFIKWSVAEIKKRKPQRIIFHVKPFLDYGSLLERLGAEFFEKSYMIVAE